MKRRGTLVAAIVVGMFAATHTLAAGDVAKGKATSAMCAGCHGAAGNSTVPTFPKLAGQNENYTVKQLQDMKSNQRSVPAMTGIIAGLSDDDIANVAAYYAAQTTTTGAADPALVELGQKVYRAGNAKTGVPACTACHGPKGKGLNAAGFPSLGGQHAAYTESQLKAFRASGRGDHQGARRENDGEGRMMRDVAARLSDDEIKALASYISGLH